MSNINNGIASEYEMPGEQRPRTNNIGLPQTDYGVPMPEINRTKERICENCNKEDVCMYKEECIKAVNDILDIESRKNVFLRTHINCKKWSGKPVIAKRQ